ncbi:Proteophosphoglycan ppg4 [Rhodotorula toruloides ATCC 204091]|uniref:Proteophosphoglycan ppg4 n=1 Tax=Rhodotorula toruloides TaxID=5286 RepID=A0A0K3C5E0_RHOTO|nr:Proteophosphoglycan ppg4 [Rhodotorula toruloides ATCC 204091]KAK4335553.1 Proteophosphoglycan ppg4 [Rhodotorula toruloides]PRQ78128.1 Proteophosphoglycan ppg4 [Rhodotorula toruloides]
MDAEASTSAAVLQASDADMTIDYDGGEQPMAAGASGDAEMGDEGTTVDEAEMRDDEAHHEADATFMTAYEGDPEVLADDDETLPTSSAPVISFASTSAPFEAFSAAPVFSSAPVASSEPLATHIELDNPSETLLQPPSTSTAPEVSIPIPSEPALEPALLASVPIETDVAIVETEAPVLAPSVGDGGSAARDLEPTETTGTSTDVGAIEATSAGAKLDVIELPEPTHVDETAPAAEMGGATSAESKAPVPEPSVNLAEVETGANGVDGGSTEHSTRPLVDKDPLFSIEVPTLPSTSALREVPVVYLTHDSTTWTLFHPSRDGGSTSDDAETETEGGDEDLPLLFGDAARHELYYKPLETLFRVVREEIEELRDQGDELVVEFDEIGISLSEDNIYSRQVTLFDFDRIHTGCQIPGRLHARIYAQPRFATGFNALAEHIARIASGASEEELEEGEEGEESVTLVAEEGSEGEIREEGEEEEEGVADDHDGPDSELPQVGEDEGEKAVEAQEAQGAQGGEEGEGGDEDFDLDQALAQLDGDDVVAVVEVAQEDLLLEQQQQGGEAEAREEGEEQEPSADAEANEERVDEQAEEAVETEEGEEARADAHEEEKTLEVGQAEQVAEKEEVVAESGEVASTEAPAESTVDAAEATKTDVRSVESHPADEVAESTTVAETLDDVAPTEMNGTHEDESTTTADAPAAGEPAETAYEDVVNNATVESVGANGTLSAAAEETEEPTEPTDVVIDYDEAFDASAAPATAGENGVQATSETATATSEEMLAPTSPKRSRKFEHEEGLEGADDQTSNEAKRPRLAESVAVSSA